MSCNVTSVHRKLMLEYVLDELKFVHVLAISKTEVKRYTLKSKSELEREATDYRSKVMKQRVDDGLARRLFDDLVKPVSIYSRERNRSSWCPMGSFIFCLSRPCRMVASTC